METEKVAISTSLPKDAVIEIDCVARHPTA